METLEKILYHNDGKDYEIRVFSEGNTINVKAFLNNKPANGYTHSVEITTKFSFEKRLGYSAIQNLIDAAKDDIKNNYWDKYLEAVRKEDKK